MSFLRQNLPSLNPLIRIIQSKYIRTELKSKIHSAFVTGANLDDVGRSCRAELAARSVDDGDRIIIMAVDLTTDPIEPKMILVEAKNNYVERLEGVRHVQQIH
tara:strand:- start:24 stop:332 length:309 start_codon:yes stop_codon:yes gene_type:complete